MSKLSNQGFSLLDVIVATGLILTGVVAITALLWQITTSARYSADRFVATNLAQEGVEIVRSMRDSNWIGGGNWDNGLAGGNSDGYYVAFDARPDQNVLQNCPAQCPALKLDPATKFYNYTAGSVTKFIRTIKITNSGSNYIQVISDVKWGSGEANKVTIEDIFYNWMSN